MDLKKTLNRTRGAEDSEVNIIPVMNVFIILIPFLLLTATFVKIAILDLTLPSLGKKTGQQQVTRPKKAVVTILSIENDAFQLRAPGMKLGKIPSRDGGFDFARLAGQLKQVKKRYAGTEDIIIAPKPQIKYDVIIRVMDSCRENGFANISISG